MHSIPKSQRRISIAGSQFAIPFSPSIDIFAPTLPLPFNLFVPGTDTPAHGQYREVIKSRSAWNATERPVRRNAAWRVKFQTSLMWLTYPLSA